jgi:hypothetical protein
MIGVTVLAFKSKKFRLKLLHALIFGSTDWAPIWLEGSVRIDIWLYRLSPNLAWRICTDWCLTLQIEPQFGLKDLHALIFRSTVWAPVWFEGSARIDIWLYSLSPNLSYHPMQLICSYLTHHVDDSTYTECRIGLYIRITDKSSVSHLLLDSMNTSTAQVSVTVTTVAVQPQHMWSKPLLTFLREIFWTLNDVLCVLRCLLL